MGLITIPTMEELTFDEVRHIYRIAGETLPSVTTLMKPMSDSYYKVIPDYVLDKAAARGTAIHNAIENWIKFGIVDIRAEHRGYFDAFRDWWDKRKPTVIGSEQRLYHKLLRYAGTGDLVCIIDDKINIIDYKTTSVLSEMLVRVQMEAYAKALESHGFHADEKRALHLKKDGSWAEPTFQAGDTTAWRVFGALKTVYDYTESYEK